MSEASSTSEKQAELAALSAEVVSKRRSVYVRVFATVAAIVLCVLNIFAAFAADEPTYLVFALMLIIVSLFAFTELSSSRQKLKEAIEAATKVAAKASEASKQHVTPPARFPANRR